MTATDGVDASSPRHSLRPELKARSFREVVAWRRSMELAKTVYLITRTWPRDEQYGLTSQVRRAAVSVPSNIAEGHGRQGATEFARFVSIALGSLNEVETQIQLAIDLDYMAPDQAQDTIALCHECRRIARALLISLRHN